METKLSAALGEWTAGSQTRGRSGSRLLLWCRMSAGRSSSAGTANAQWPFPDTRLTALRCAALAPRTTMALHRRCVRHGHRRCHSCLT